MEMPIIPTLMEDLVEDPVDSEVAPLGVVLEAILPGVDLEGQLLLPTMMRNAGTRFSSWKTFYL